MTQNSMAMSIFLRWAASMSKLHSAQLRKSYSSREKYVRELENENIDLQLAQLQLLQARKDRQHFYAGTELMMGFQAQRLLDIQNVDHPRNEY